MLEGRSAAPFHSTLAREVHICSHLPQEEVLAGGMDSPGGRLLSSTLTADISHPLVVYSWWLAGSPPRLVWLDQRIPTWPDPAGFLPPGGRSMPCSHHQRDAECELAAASLSQGSTSPPSPAPHWLHAGHNSLISRDTFWRAESIIRRRTRRNLALGPLPAPARPSCHRLGASGSSSHAEEGGRQKSHRRDLQSSVGTAILEGKGSHGASCPAPTAQGSQSAACSCSCRCCRRCGSGEDDSPSRKQDFQSFSRETFHPVLMRKSQSHSTKRKASGKSHPSSSDSLYLHL